MAILSGPEGNPERSLRRERKHFSLILAAAMGRKHYFIGFEMDMDFRAWTGRSRRSASAFCSANDAL
jgi:hypothetical protein